jgi:hypothetical protein
MRAAVVTAFDRPLTMKAVEAGDIDARVVFDFRNSPSA